MESLIFYSLSCCRENFLKVDVFYGELVHDVIQASAAYPLTEFFSKSDYICNHVIAANKSMNRANLIYLIVITNSQTALQNSLQMLLDILIYNLS